MGWCFWIDRGGTFTDLIGRDPEGQLHVRKVLSEQAGAGDPAVSAMEAVLASASPPVDLGDVDDVRLGTTVSTNALLEGAGAPLASRRRATGTLPHSQAGRAKPIRAPMIGASTGFLGSRSIQAPGGTAHRASPAMATPSSRNGTASSSNP